MAIKGAQRQMNYPNSDKSGKKPGEGMQCFRCGSKDHLARDCNLPRAKSHAFNLTKGGNGGKKGGRNSKSNGEMDYHLSEEGGGVNQVILRDGMAKQLTVVPSESTILKMIKTLLKDQALEEKKKRLSCHNGGRDISP